MHAEWKWHTAKWIKHINNIIRRNNGNSINQKDIVAYVLIIMQIYTLDCMTALKISQSMACMHSALHLEYWERSWGNHRTANESNTIIKERNKYGNWRYGVRMGAMRQRGWNRNVGVYRKGIKKVKTEGPPREWELMWMRTAHIIIEQNAIYMNNKIENSIRNAFKCNEAFMFQCL